MHCRYRYPVLQLAPDLYWHENINQYLDAIGHSNQGVHRGGGGGGRVKSLGAVKSWVHF